MQGLAELFFFSPIPSSPLQGDGMQEITASSAATIQPWEEQLDQ